MISNRIPEVPEDLRIAGRPNGDDRFTFVREKTDLMSGFHELYKGKNERLIALAKHVCPNDQMWHVEQEWHGQQTAYFYTCYRPCADSINKEEGLSFVFSTPLPRPDDQAQGIFQRAIAALTRVWPF